MARYHFVTRWYIDAPIDDVFEAISQSGRWPEWWKGVEAVTELEHGDETGVGRRQAMVWKSILPYRLRFEIVVTRVQRPFALEGRATGELEGTGRWDIRAAPSGGTDVTYFWDIRTTRAWMNAFGPLAAPVFRWNHDYVMAAGGRGLAGLLQGRSTRPTG